MALSDHERRALDAIEQSLLQEDPRLRQAGWDAGPNHAERGRFRLGLGLLVVGLVGLVLGVAVTLALGIVGFCLMFAGGVLMLPALKKWSAARQAARSTKPTPPRTEQSTA